MPNEHRQYIGDGVYASFDGYHIWLDTDRGGMLHEIALEPQVFTGLIQYAERLKKELSSV